MWIVLVLLLVGGACGDVEPAEPDVPSTRPDEEAVAMTTHVDEPAVAAVRRWIREHPEGFSAVVRPAGGATHLDERADVPRQTASTFKTVVLVAYARAVADGVLDPEASTPVEDVGRWLVAGTDGGAHDVAMAALAADGRLTLDEVAAAMIEHSDNAATDHLLARLGRGAVEDAMADIGLPHLAAIATPTAGALLAASEGIDELAAAPVAERADRAWAAAGRFAADPASATRAIQTTVSGLPSWSQQQRLGAALPWWASADDLATLLERVVLQEQLGEQVSEIVLGHLSWTQRAGDLEESHAVAAAKDGATAGVLTAVAVVQPVDGPFADQPRVVVVSLSGLAMATWVDLFEREAVLRLALALGSEPAAVDAIEQDLRS